MNEKLEWRSRVKEPEAPIACCAVCYGMFSPSMLVEKTCAECRKQPVKSDLQSGRGSLPAYLQALLDERESLIQWAEKAEESANYYQASLEESQELAGALTQERDQLRAALEALKISGSEWETDFKSLCKHLGVDVEADADSPEGWINIATGNYDQLRAENAGLTERYEALEKSEKTVSTLCDETLVENERLREALEKIAEKICTDSVIYTIAQQALAAKGERTERCVKCGKMVSDWVDPDWAHGRICRKCEAVHEPKGDGISDDTAAVKAAYAGTHSSDCMCHLCIDNHQAKGETK